MVVLEEELNAERGACPMRGPAPSPRPLVLPRSVHQRLKAEVAAGGTRSPEEAQEAQRQAEHLERLRHDAHALAQQMSRHLPQQEHVRLAAKGALRAQAAKARRESDGRRATEERKQQHLQILQRCRELLAQRNNPGRRQLDSALLFAETLRERRAQVAFEAQLREAQERFERAWKERIEGDWARQDEVQRHKQEVATQRRCAYRDALFKQLEDNAEERRAVQGRLAKERQQLDAMRLEEEAAKALHKEGAKVRQEACRKANLESIEDFRRSQQLRHATDQEEERVAAVHRQLQAQISATCKERQRQRMEEATRARDKIGEKIWCAYKDHLKWLADEDKKRHETQEEEERRWREREQMEADHRKCVVAYRQQGHKEWLELAAQQKAAAVGGAKYFSELRERQTEEIAREEVERRQRERDKKMDARRDYLKQMEEKKEQVKAEEENEKKFQAITQSLWEEDDNQFFKYADELIQDSQAKGRMLLPLQRTIYEYKKKNQLLPRTKRRNTVKTPDKC